MRDTANAFIDMFTLDGATDGVLRGLTFGAKDLFDVAGHITSCGSPDKAAAAGAAAATAPAVAALLDAGGRLVGKTHTDEIAYEDGGQRPLGPPEQRRARPGAGGLLLRLGRRRRRRPGRFRAGQRHRRLGAAAGLVLRGAGHPHQPWGD